MNKPVSEDGGREWRQTPEWQIQERELKEWNLPLMAVALLESHRGNKFPASADK